MTTTELRSARHYSTLVRRKMKTHITLFLIFTHLLCGTELVTLISSMPDEPSDIISLTENETFTLIDHHGLTSNLSGESWQITGNLNLKITKDTASYFFNGEKDTLVVAGPATIQLFHGVKLFVDESGNLTSSQTQATMITGKIESSESIDELIVSNSSVVLPSNTIGNFSITLESSTDLVNWNTTSPGIYNSGNNQRFFRVKATESKD